MKLTKKMHSLVLMLGLVAGLTFGGKAQAIPDVPLGSLLGAFGTIYTALTVDFGWQTAHRAPVAGNYDLVARYYTLVAYQYAAAAYNTPN